MQKPIQRVKFTKTIARYSKIRDQNPSLGLICPGGVWCVCVCVGREEGRGEEGEREGTDGGGRREVVEEERRGGEERLYFSPFWDQFKSKIYRLNVL